jgi:cell division septal protein FtsQ
MAVKGRSTYLRGRDPLGQGIPATPVRRTKARRRWARRTVRAVLAAGGLIGGTILVQAGWDFLRSDGAFGIRQIRVVGLQRHDGSALRARLADLAGSNLFVLKPEEVSRRIADFAWLQGFLCRKHLPDTLIVEVIERTPLCTVTTDKGTYEIGGDGVCWPGLPGVPGTFRLASGLYVGDPEVQRLLAAMLQANLGGKVSDVSSGPDPHSYTLSAPEGWRLVVTTDGLQEEWRRFESAKGWVAAYAPGRKTLDCRWAGRVVIEPAPAGQGDGKSTGQEPQGGQPHG